MRTSTGNGYPGIRVSIRYPDRAQYVHEILKVVNLTIVRWTFSRHLVASQLRYSDIQIFRYSNSLRQHQTQHGVLQGHVLEMDQMQLKSY